MPILLTDRTVPSYSIPSPPALITAAPPPTDALAAGVGLHDDLVLSESSSGEEDSGSDSDSDSD